MKGSPHLGRLRRFHAPGDAPLSQRRRSLADPMSPDGGSFSRTSRLMEMLSPDSFFEIRMSWQRVRP